MWIVRLALRQPHTIVVLIILIFLLGGLAIVRTPIDIFPNIDIPVVSIIWNFNGLPPQEMADRIISVTERNLTTVVDNIQHVESQSLYGIAVVKVFFQPGVSIDRAIAQITASSQTQLRQLPQGTTPPLVITYSASTVPILPLGLSGQGLSEKALNGYGLNFIRTQLVTVPGTAVPYPYGGKQREVQVDLNTAALQSKGLSPLDVVNAITAQNLILPTGTSKIGMKEYDVDIPNAAPETIAQLNRIPIKTIGTTTIYISDVAWVRDGFPPQTNIVRVNGQRASLLTVQKRSTLTVHAHDVGLRRKAVAHPSNIADVNGRGADGFDGDAVELCDRFRSRVGNINVVLLHADFGSAGWQNKILSSDGIDHVQGGKTFRL